MGYIYVVEPSLVPGLSLPPDALISYLVARDLQAMGLLGNRGTRSISYVIRGRNAWNQTSEIPVYYARGVYCIEVYFQRLVCLQLAIVIQIYKPAVHIAW